MGYTEGRATLLAYKAALCPCARGCACTWLRLAACCEDEPLPITCQTALFGAGGNFWMGNALGTNSLEHAAPIASSLGLGLLTPSNSPRTSAPRQKAATFSSSRSLTQHGPLQKLPPYGVPAEGDSATGAARCCEVLAMVGAGAVGAGADVTRSGIGSSSGKFTFLRGWSARACSS